MIVFGINLFGRACVNFSQCLMTDCYCLREDWERVGEFSSLTSQV